MRQQLVRQVVAGYLVLVGITILATWIFILRIGDVPQAFERPSELTLHISAEVAALYSLLSTLSLLYSDGDESSSKNLRRVD